MKKILLVDDEELLLAIVEEYLTPIALVETVTSVAAALTRLEQQVFDCVVSDFYLPEATGKDLVEHLRAQGNKTPVILMSGSHVLPEEASAFAAYIKKPFEPEDIQELVKKIMEVKNV